MDAQSGGLFLFIADVVKEIQATKYHFVVALYCNPVILKHVDYPRKQILKQEVSNRNKLTRAAIIRKAVRCMSKAKRVDKRPPLHRGLDRK